jgi:hypothetical protein
MEVSGQFHDTAALSPGKSPPVPIGYLVLPGIEIGTRVPVGTRIDLKHEGQNGAREIIYET